MFKYLTLGIIILIILVGGGFYLYQQNILNYWLSHLGLGFKSPSTLSVGGAPISSTATDTESAKKEFRSNLLASMLAIFDENYKAPIYVDKPVSYQSIDSDTKPTTSSPSIKRGLYNQKEQFDEKKLKELYIILENLKQALTDLEEKLFDSLFFGIEEYHAGNYEKSLDYFLLAEKLFSGDADVKLFVALAYLQLNNNEKAKEKLKEVLSLDQNYIDAHFQLGVIYATEKKTQEAINHLLRVYNYDPKQNDVGFFLGLSYYRADDFYQAQKYLLRNQSIDIVVEGLDAYYLILTKYQLGYNSEAAKLAREFVINFDKIQEISSLMSIVNFFVQIEKLDDYFAKFVTIPLGPLIFSHPPEMDFLDFRGETGRISGKTGDINYMNIFYNENGLFYRISLMGDKNYTQALGFNPPTINEYFVSIQTTPDFMQENIEKNGTKIKTKDKKDAFVHIISPPSGQILSAYIFDASREFPRIEISFQDKGVRLLDSASTQSSPEYLLSLRSSVLFKHIIESVEISGETL